RRGTRFAFGSLFYSAKRRSGKCVHNFSWRQLAMLPRLEPSEVESTELHAFEGGHLVTDGIEHPPHLAILALRQFDQQMRFARRRLAQRGTSRQERYVSFDDP